MKVVFSEKANKYLKERLSRFSSEKRLAFGIVCCERMFPIYSRFSKVSLWKTPESLRRFIDLLWDYILDRENIAISKKDLKMSLKIIPDCDNKNLYDRDPEGLLDAACNAGCAVAHLIELAIKNNPEALLYEIPMIEELLLDTLLAHVEFNTEKLEEYSFAHSIEEVLQNPLNPIEVVSDEANDKRGDETEHARNVLCSPLIQRELQLLLDVLNEIETCNDIGLLRKKYGNCEDGCLFYRDEQSGETILRPLWERV